MLGDIVIVREVKKDTRGPCHEAIVVHFTELTSYRQSLKQIIE